MHTSKRKQIDQMLAVADSMIADNLSKLSKSALKRAVLTRNLAPRPFFWNNGVLSWSLNNISATYTHNNRLLAKKLSLKLVDEALFYYGNYDNISDTHLDDAINSLLNLPKNSRGSILYRPTDKNIFVDTLGMAPPLLVKYGLERGRSDCISLAVLQFDLFMELAIDSATGLPYHAYHSDSGLKMGIIGWGRGLGWILIGLAECLNLLESSSSEFKRLETYFKDLIDKSLGYQLQNGGFSWQLQATEGPVDTSTASMIGYALSRYTSITHNVGYKENLESIVTFILDNTGPDGAVRNSSAECRGLSIYPQIFEINSWGQGFSILLLRSLETKAR